MLSLRIPEAKLDRRSSSGMVTETYQQAEYRITLHLLSRGREKLRKRLLLIAFTWKMMLSGYIPRGRRIGRVLFCPANHRRSQSGQAFWAAVGCCKRLCVCRVGFSLTAGFLSCLQYGHFSAFRIGKASRAAAPALGTRKDSRFEASSASLHFLLTWKTAIQIHD